MSFKPVVYAVKRQVVNPDYREGLKIPKFFYKHVGTIAMDPDGKNGKLFLNMFDEEYRIYPSEDR